MVFCTDNDRLDNVSTCVTAATASLFDTEPDGTLALKGQPVAKSLQPFQGELARAPSVARARAALAYVEISSPEVHVLDPTERLVSQIHDYVRAHDARLLVALQSKRCRLIARLKTEQIPFVTLDGAPAYKQPIGAHFTPRVMNSPPAGCSATERKRPHDAISERTN